MRDDNSASVPLPHGTDVVTRADRELQHGRVAAGTAGRVVAVDGDAVDVQILGVGVVRYARSELTPFRAGQVRYAVARDAAWSALHRNVVLETVVGSRAWGLADEGSDEDLRGVFVLPFPWTARLGGAPTDLLSVDGSATYWELEKALQQALRADPNTLEMLFVPSARAHDAMGEWILQERDAFVSARIYASFGQYAVSQLRKLRRSLRLAEHRDVVLQWLRENPSITLDSAAVRLASETSIEAPTEPARHALAKEYLKQLYGSLFDHGLLPEKTFAALRLYAGAQTAASALPASLRPKNAYNLLRLLITATGWLRTGEPRFDMHGPQHGELLAIKRGQVELPNVLARAEDLAKELDEAHRSTTLPQQPDVARAQQLLHRIREESARRWLNASSGPFGLGSAPVSNPEWNP